MSVVVTSAPRKEIGRVSLAEVKEKGLLRMSHPPFDVLVAWSDGEVFAMEDACNHAGASLAEGWIKQGCVVCPMHAYMFELRSGKLVRPRGLCGDQRTFEVEIEGDEIAVYDAFSLELRT
ncbi:MAG TPA: Rieske 2Fe-2S domain-containing protein [Labilithrix sp.]|nr:Rieske 2Fe-2S domain-containing protein [Labilithrix sp.]